MDINYFAVLVATIAAFVIGALWYGPFFGKQWRHLMGIHGDRKGKMPMQPMVGGFFATLVMVYVYAVLKSALNASVPEQAVWLALMLAIGFIGTTQLNSVLYERRPFKLYAINLGHYLVVLAAAALVLACW